MSQKGSAPTSPDMTAAAEAMGLSSQRNIRQQTWANRPNLVTPWGSMSWEAQPFTGYGAQEGQPPPSPRGGVPSPTDLNSMLDPALARGGFAGDFPDYSGIDLGAPGVQAPDIYGPGAPRSPGRPGIPPPTGGGRLPVPTGGTGPGRPGIPPPTGGGRLPVPTGGTGPGRPDIPPSTGGSRTSPAPPYGSAGQVPLEQWTGTLTLSPEQQAIFESQQRIQGGRSQLAEDLLGGARDELGRPVDWQGFPARPDDMEAARNRAEENIYGRYASRLDPQFQQREQALTSQLYNQGLRPGDEAWDTAMANLGRERADAYQTALRESVMGGGTEARAAGQYQQGLRSSAIAEELQRRGWSLNEIQALLGGAQVGLPQMPSFAQAGAAQATQYLPAAQQQFNNAMQGWQAQQQANQGFLSGLAGIGSIPFMF